MSSVDTIGLSVFQFKSLLGLGKFTGAIPAGDDYSPNMFLGLFITDEAMNVVDYDGRVLSLPTNYPVDINAIASSVSQSRRLNGLEQIGVSASLGGIASARRLGVALTGSQCRLVQVGVAGKDGVSLERSEVFEGGSLSVNPSQPEHYVFDREILKPFFDNRMLGDGLVSVDDVVDMSDDFIEDTEDVGGTEPVLSEEELKAEELRQQVGRFFANAINSTIEYISSEFTKMYSSGYEVFKPAGILVEHDGYPTWAYLDGDSVVYHEGDLGLQEFYKKVVPLLGFTECEHRKYSDIGSIITTGRDTTGSAVASSKPVFPFKVLEYAFGRNISKNSDSNSFPRASSAKSWAEYLKRDVRPSFEAMLPDLLYRKLKTANLLDSNGYRSSDGLNAVMEVLEAFKASMCTSILVSRFESDAKTGAVSAIKIRVLDYEKRLSRSEDYLSSALRSVGILQDGDSNVFIMPVRSSGAFVEYSVELNAPLANASPSFAYHAIRAVKKQGHGVDFNSGLLGRNPNDEIVRNGSAIVDMTNVLIHILGAGSRYGKGVMGGTWVPPLLETTRDSGLFGYADNKPDTVSMLAHIEPSGAFINGANYVYSVDEGTDYFGSMRFMESPLPEPSMRPKYLSSLMGGSSYRSVGAVAYVRFILLCLGILGARFELSGNPEIYNLLGGKGGFHVFFDEVGNAASNFQNIANAMRNKAATGYFNSYKQAVESGKKEPSDKPDMLSYWLRWLYLNMSESASYIDQLNNAGLQNSEKKVSNFFVITQEAPTISANKGEFFPPLNKSSLGFPGKADALGMLTSLLLFSSADIFMGIKAQNTDYLGQSKSGSTASSYINMQKRYFAYHPDYSYSTFKRIEEPSLGDEVLYIRPFLTFSHNSRTEYFAREALKRIESSTGGAVNAEDVIAANANDDGTDLHPAVGFEGYLNEVADDGVENARRVFKRSGSAFQEVVSRMGYPGSWRDFIYDMRPDWFFNASDVTKCLSTTQTVPELNATRMEDFLTLYPDAFYVVSSTPESVGSAEDFESMGMGDTDYTFSSVDDGAGTGSLEDAEPAGFPAPSPTAPTMPVSPQPAGFGSAPVVPPTPSAFDSVEVPLGFEDMPTVPLGGSQPSEPFIPAPLSDDTPTIPLSSPYDEPFVLPSTYQPGVMDDMRDYWDSLERNGKLPPSAVDVDSPLSVDSAGGFQTPPVSARAVPFNPSQPTMDINSARSLSEVMVEVTKCVQEVVGSFSNVESVRVIDSQVVVNDLMVKFSFSDSFLASAPPATARQLQSNMVAHLVMWDVVFANAVSMIKLLSFDDTAFVSNYISPAIGLGGRISIPEYFGFFKRLSTLVIGGSSFDRGTYRKTLGESDFNQRTRVYAVSNALRERSWEMARRRGNVVRTTWGRSDIGKVGKATRTLWHGSLALAGAVGAGTGSAGQGASVGRSKLSKVSRVFSAVKRL